MKIKSIINRWLLKKQIKECRHNIETAEFWAKLLFKSSDCIKDNIHELENVDIKKLSVIGKREYIEHQKRKIEYFEKRLSK